VTSAAPPAVLLKATSLPKMLRLITMEDCWYLASYFKPTQFVEWVVRLAFVPVPVYIEVGALSWSKLK
jgi:hypothetical protein